jgi:hypothetical protein
MGTDLYTAIMCWASPGSHAVEGVGLQPGVVGFNPDEGVEFRPLCLVCLL